MNIGNRTFGIELECFMPRGKTRLELAAAMVAAGVECESERYSHATRPHWKLVDDGSLGDYSRGVEIVSPIMKGESGINEVATVCRVLTAFGCSVNVKTGFHCHVGIADFTSDQMKKLTLNFIWFETFFDHIMPVSRRANNGQYVNSNRARFGGYGTSAVNNAFTRIGDIDSLCTSETNKIHAIIGGISGNTRYLKLNLASYHRYQTVEFRQHSGTVDAEKVTNWARLMVAFVEKSKVSRPRPRTVERDLSPVEEMNRFFAYIPVDSEVKAFYMARRKALANEERTAFRVEANDLQNGGAIAREMITALNNRAAHVSAFARPQVRVAAICTNAARDLQYALAGNHDGAGMTRAQAVAASIARVRAQNIVTAIR